MKSKSASHYLSMPGVQACKLFSFNGIFRAILFTVFIAALFSGCKRQDDPDASLGYFSLKWKTKLPAETSYSSPALNADESILYTGTSLHPVPQGDTSQVFVAIYTGTGKRKWSRSLGNRVLRSAPAVAPDGSILLSVELYDPAGFPSGDEIWCLSPNGTDKWKYNINHGVQRVDVGISTPAVSSDGTVYVAGDSLYAINPDGTLKWRTLGKTGEMMRSSPVIAEDGTVYFVSHNVPLTAFNPTDGSVKWSCHLGADDHCFSSPAIGNSGTIYAATQPGIIYAVSDQGQISWSFTIESAGYTGYLRSSPAVDQDGSVYFGINNGYPSSAFFALNADGTVKWIFEPADLPPDVPSSHFDIYSSPALSDSLVFFGHEFGRVYALSRADGTLTGIFETTSGITWPSPAIDSKGVLYISDLKGVVFALQTNTTGLDYSAPWPKYRNNNSNDGRK